MRGAAGIAADTPRAGLGPGPAGYVANQGPAPVGEIDHGPRTRRWVALTFDADMTRGMLARLRDGRQPSWYDPRIAGELRRARVPATIFLTGLWTAAYPRVARGFARRHRWFELENHSVDHAGWLAPCYGLPGLRGLGKRAEIERAAATIHRVTGVRPRYFRFPGGCHAARDLRLVAAAGERPVGWDVVSGDAFQPDPAPIVRQVLDETRPGSIVVLHLVGAPNAPATAAALPGIIAGLRGRGYRFVLLRQLLAGH